jgi:hypothetical protein
MGADTVTRGTPPTTVPGTEQIILDQVNNQLYTSGLNGAPVAVAYAGKPLALTAQTTATSATAGAATALPATPAGYLDVTINGTAAKIPYYAT